MVCLGEHVNLTVPVVQLWDDTGESIKKKKFKKMECLDKHCSDLIVFIIISANSQNARYGNFKFGYRYCYKKRK